MKLALGTVQFGLSYGIHNTHGIPSDEEVTQLLSIAAKEQIHTLDTAYAYGNAEERLGQLGTTLFRIISKFPMPENGLQLSDYLTTSCKRLKRDKLDAYMAHNAGILLTQPAIWQELLQLKEGEKVEKIGFSLYHPDELEQLLKLNMIPDIVQVPYSLLDRKFEPYFTSLKENGCEIHTRSAFLQGLYFMQPDQLPAKLEPMKEALITLQKIASDSSLSMEALALRFVCSNHAVDFVVIGTETTHQLRANCTAANGDLSDEITAAIRAIELKHPELLNPSVWHA